MGIRCNSSRLHQVSEVRLDQRLGICNDRQDVRFLSLTDLMTAMMRWSMIDRCLLDIDRYLPWSALYFSVILRQSASHIQPVYPVIFNQFTQSYSTSLPSHIQPVYPVIFSQSTQSYSASLPSHIQPVYPVIFNQSTQSYSASLPSHIQPVCPVIFNQSTQSYSTSLPSHIQPVCPVIFNQSTQPYSVKLRLRFLFLHGFSSASLSFQSSHVCVHLL